MSPEHLKLLYLRSNKTSSSRNLLFLQDSLLVIGSTNHPAPQMETWDLPSLPFLSLIPHIQLVASFCLFFLWNPIPSLHPQSILSLALLVPHLDQCHSFSLTPTLGIFSGRFFLPIGTPQRGLDAPSVHTASPSQHLSREPYSIFNFVSRPAHHKHLEGGDCILLMHNSQLQTASGTCLLLASVC